MSDSQFELTNRFRDIAGTAEVNNFGLRPYQREAIVAAIKGFNRYKLELVVSPTGDGKTIMFATLTEHFLHEVTLVLVHRDRKGEAAS
jgi:superfamily II DNA or RNA helicase